MTDIRATTVLPARRAADHADHGGRAAAGRRAGAARGPRPGRDARLPAPAADPRRDDGQPRVPQGGEPAARAGGPRRAAVQHAGYRSRSRARARASSATARRSGSTSRPRCATRVAAGLPDIWLLGWSFGTELTLRWGLLPGVQGGILLSPPLRRATDQDLDRWAADGQAADRARARVRRLPAPRRGSPALRPRAQGGGHRRRRREAPVGGGELRAHRARPRSSGRSTPPPCTAPRPCQPPGTTNPSVA